MESEKDLQDQEDVCNARMKILDARIDEWHARKLLRIQRLQELEAEAKAEQCNDDNEICVEDSEVDTPKLQAETRSDYTSRFEGTPKELGETLTGREAIEKTKCEVTQTFVTRREVVERSKAGLKSYKGNKTLSVKEAKQKAKLLQLDSKITLGTLKFLSEMLWAKKKEKDQVCVQARSEVGWV